jgi:hypothetical protein
MRGNIFLRILSAIILVALVVGAGVFVYNAGVAQGLATSGQAVASNGQGTPGPYYYYAPFYRPWGFGPFGLIFPLLFVFLIFLAVRGLFFRDWRRHGPWMRYGPYDYGRRDVPPMAEEWHRKMHEEQADSGE